MHAVPGGISTVPHSSMSATVPSPRRPAASLRPSLRPSTLGLSLLALVALLAGSPVSSFAQEKKELPPPEPHTLITDDGLNLAITYYRANAGKETPVVVLLHMKDGNRFVWKSFAERLHKENYAVITVDLRGHGESRGAGAAPLPAGGAGGGNANQPATKDTKKGDAPKKAADTPKKPATTTATLKPVDYANMVALDLEAVKKFIFQENEAEKLNMNKMAIVGAEMSAAVAAYYAVRDWSKTPHPDGVPGAQTPRGQDVRALVLISPQGKFPPAMPLSAAIKTLSTPAWGIAHLVCVGANAPGDNGDAKKFYTTLKAFPGNSERMYFEEYPAKLTGTDLLGKNLKVEEHTLAFLNRHLRTLPASWRVRTSKLSK